MNLQIALILLFNSVMAIIGTLAYSVRLVGVRTGKIASAGAAFNVLSLASRVASTLQAPLLSKTVESGGTAESARRLFLLIIFVSGCATVLGAFLVPSFQRLFCKVVVRYSVDRSFPKVMIRGMSRAGARTMRQSWTRPKRSMLRVLHWKKLPKKVLCYNLLSVALLTVGSFAPILAGAYFPALRLTCVSLSAVINGAATIALTLFVDPYLSILTDDVMCGTCPEERFRACIIAMVVTKTLGTFAALFLLVPGAHLIGLVAEWI